MFSHKGHKAHVFDAQKEMINIATLDDSDLYDLFANVDFALSVESKRDELENSFKKTIKKSKKFNHKNKEENPTLLSIHSLLKCSYEDARGNLIEKKTGKKIFLMK